MKYRDKLHISLGFSAGAVLGVALFDLLPESIQMTSDVYSLQTIMALVAVGFAAYLLVDRLVSLHKHDDCEKPAHNSKFSASALVLHSFLDGFGIGLAFQISNSVGWIVAIAVIAHSFSDGINTVGVILKGKGNKKAVQYWLIVGLAAPAVGVICAYFISVSATALGLLLALFVGLFLYISTSDLIPESHHNHRTIWTTIATIGGLALIFAITSLIK